MQTLTHSCATLEEASTDLLHFVLTPENWVSLFNVRPQNKMAPKPDYQRAVGSLKVAASVDITPKLDVLLRIGFREPGLTPMKAVELLEVFLKDRLPLVPNSEWEVEVDPRKWIYFSRRYTQGKLKA